MLLNTSLLEKRGPRFWSRAATAGLLSGAVVLSGLGLKAAAAPVPAPKEEPKQEAPKPELKKEQPKKEQAPAAPDIPNLHELLPADLPPGVAEQFKKQMEQMDQLMKRMQEQGGGIWINPGLDPGWGGARELGLPGFLGRNNAVKGRMGALVKSPDATLTEQLELPKNQGLVIEDVKGDSPAAKAGLKANDILLELNGKPVSSEPKEFVKMLDDIKPNTPVDAVVLRKGKKETVKGLSMPEAPKPAPSFGLTPKELPGGHSVKPID